MGLAACKVVRCMQQELSQDPGVCLEVAIRGAYVAIRGDVAALAEGDKKDRITYDSVIEISEQRQMTLKQQEWMLGVIEWLAGMADHPGIAPSDKPSW